MLTATIFVKYPDFFFDILKVCLSLPTYAVSLYKTIFVSFYSSLLVFVNIIYFMLTYYSIYITTLLICQEKNLNIYDFLPRFVLKNSNNSEGIKQEPRSYFDLYKQTDLFMNVNYNQKTFNFTFENSFYKLFLHDLVNKRPVDSSDTLLIIYPSYYTEISLKPSTNIKDLNPNYKYLPNTTTTMRGQNLSNFFYLPNLSFKELNYLATIPELLNINISIKDQVDLINLLRWSYRYSNIHRRTMFNSHKITESKKLLSSGFFDINLPNENL